MGSIAVNRSLTALNLEGNGLTAEAAGAIASALQRSVSLQVLAVGNNSLGDAGVIAICRGLEAAYATTSSTRPYVAEFVCLLLFERLVDSPSLLGCAVCPTCRHPLTLLDVSKNGVGARGAVALANLLKHPSCRLTDLLVSQNPLSSDGCVALATAIRDVITSSDSAHLNLSLRYLDVTGVDFGSEGLPALQAAADTAHALLDDGSGSDGFQIDGTADVWLPATIGGPPLSNRSTGVSEFTAMSMVGPISMAPTDGNHASRRPSIDSVTPTMGYPSQTPPVGGQHISPSSLEPPPSRKLSSAAASPLSATNAMTKVALIKRSASPDRPTSVPVNDSTVLLIEMLHKQLQEQQMEIAELKASVAAKTEQARSATVTVRRVETPEVSFEDSFPHKKLSQALAVVASRGTSFRDDLNQSSSVHSVDGRGSTSQPAISLPDWGFKSSSQAASSTRRLVAVEVRFSRKRFVLA
jgi:hypothetical protein